MARVNQNPFGELRGKVGNNVFSRNRYGAIVRAYTVPSQPNSVAQIEQRTRLGNVSAGFKNLTSNQLRTWEQYAQHSYVPRRKTNRGNYTSHSAYVGVNSFLAQINSSLSPITMLKDAVAVPGGDITQTAVTSPQLNAPLNQITTSFNNDWGPLPDSDPIFANFLNFNSDFSNSIVLTVPPGQRIKPIAETPKFEGSNYFNFLIMCSTPSTRQASRPKNFEAFTVCSTGNLAVDLGSSSAESLTINFPPNPNMMKYSKAPVAGQWVTLTIYIYNEFGAYQRLTTERWQVTGTP